MADSAVKTKVSVPIWTIITFVLSVLIGSAGWINAGLQARSDSSHIESNAKIGMLENEDDRQNQLIVANTMAISDIKTDVTDRLARIETVLVDIQRRLR